MQYDETPLNQENGNNLARFSAKGSGLVLCLVFLSALSITALSALEAAWSGQRMISAYVSHQQTFIRLEHALLLAEQEAWQQIKLYGMEQFLSASHDVEDFQRVSVISRDAEWLSEHFSHPQCGPLFGVGVYPANNSGSHSGLGIQWNVCCESSESCLAAEFTQQRRLWFRQIGMGDF